MNIGKPRKEVFKRLRREEKEPSPFRENKKFFAKFYKYLHMEMCGPGQYTVAEIRSSDLKDVILPKNCEKFELIEVTVIEEKINGQYRETSTKIGKGKLFYIGEYLGERSMGHVKVTCAKTARGEVFEIYSDESDEVFLIDPIAVKNRRIYPNEEFDHVRDDKLDDPFSDDPFSL